MEFSVLLLLALTTGFLIFLVSQSQPKTHGHFPPGFIRHWGGKAIAWWCDMGSEVLETSCQVSTVYGLMGEMVILWLICWIWGTLELSRDRWFLSLRKPWLGMSWVALEEVVCRDQFRMERTWKTESIVNAELQSRCQSQQEGPAG